MNRLDFLVRKNKGKNVKIDFLKEIGSLLCSDSYTIHSLEETDELTAKINQQKLLENEKKIFRTAFNDRSLMQKIITSIAAVYKHEVFLSIGYSQYCGLVSFVDINNFNVDFSFDSEHSGLIILYSKNFDNRLIIDFYEEDEKFYDLELAGGIWANINY